MMNKIKDLGFKKVISGFGNPLVDGRDGMIEGRKDWIGLLNQIDDSWSISDGTQKCIDFSWAELLDGMGSWVSILRGKPSLCGGNNDNDGAPYH